MKNWDQRPFEVKNLFNPAFCSLVLCRSFTAYQEENPAGMPFSLALIILPLCLHQNSRAIIETYSRRYLLKIIEENPHILIGLANRTTNLLPFTFEALGLAMKLGCFEISADGRFLMLPKALRKNITGTTESIACQRVAKTIGREFARIADRVTIYTSFGIRP